MTYPSKTTSIYCSILTYYITFAWISIIVTAIRAGGSTLGYAALNFFRNGSPDLYFDLLTLPYFIGCNPSLFYKNYRGFQLLKTPILYPFYGLIFALRILAILRPVLSFHPYLLVNQDYFYNTTPWLPLRGRTPLSWKREFWYNLSRPDGTTGAFFFLDDFKYGAIHGDVLSLRLTFVKGVGFTLMSYRFSTLAAILGVIILRYLTLTDDRLPDFSKFIKSIIETELRALRTELLLVCLYLITGASFSTFPVLNLLLNYNTTARLAPVLFSCIIGGHPSDYPVTNVFLDTSGRLDYGNLQHLFTLYTALDPRVGIFVSQILIPAIRLAITVNPTVYLQFALRSIKNNVNKSAVWSWGTTLLLSLLSTITHSLFETNLNLLPCPAKIFRLVDVLMVTDVFELAVTLGERSPAFRKIVCLASIITCLILKYLLYVSLTNLIIQ